MNDRNGPVRIIKPATNLIPSNSGELKRRHRPKFKPIDKSLGKEWHAQTEHLRSIMDEVRYNKPVE